MGGLPVASPLTQRRHVIDNGLHVRLPATPVAWVLPVRARVSADCINAELERLPGARRLALGARPLQACGGSSSSSPSSGGGSSSATPRSCSYVSAVPSGARPTSPAQVRRIKQVAAVAAAASPHATDAGDHSALPASLAALLAHQQQHQPQQQQQLLQLQLQQRYNLQHTRREPATANSQQLPDGGGAPGAASSAAAAPVGTSAPDVGAATASTEEGERELHRELMDCTHWQDVLDVVEDEAEALGTHNIVVALGRLTKLGRRLPAPARAAMLGAPGFLTLLRLLAAALPAMSPFQLVNSLYSAAVLGAPLGATPALLSRIDAAVRSLAPAFNARDAASTMYAYALLRHNPPRAALSALCRRSRVLLDEGGFEAQGLSMLLWGAGSLGLRSPPLAESALRALAAAGGPAALVPQAVANSVWGLAKMGAALPPALLDAALAVVSTPGSGTRPQELLNVLWACVRARHHPGVRLAAVVRYAAARAADLAAADLASLFHALGMFGHHPGPSALAALLPRAAALLPSMAPLEVCSLYWGLGLLREAGNEVYASITATWLPRLAARAGGLSDSLARQALQGYLGGRLAAAAAAEDGDAATGGGVQSPVLAPGVLDGLRAAWARGAEAAAASGGASASARLVAGTLRDLGVVYEAAMPAADGLATVDVALRAGGGRWVALQVAGEHEYASNIGAPALAAADAGGKRGGGKRRDATAAAAAGRGGGAAKLLGPALLQRDVLERSGWDVRFLRAAEFVQLPAAQRPRMLAELLRSLGVSVRAQAVTRAAAAAEQRAAGGGGSDTARHSAGAAASAASSSAGVKLDEFELLMATMPAARQQAAAAAAAARRGGRRL